MQALESVRIEQVERGVVWCGVFLLLLLAGGGKEEIGFDIVIFEFSSSSFCFLAAAIEMSTDEIGDMALRIYDKEGKKFSIWPVVVSLLQVCI